VGPRAGKAEKGAGKSEPKCVVDGRRLWAKKKSEKKEYWRKSHGERRDKEENLQSDELRRERAKTSKRGNIKKESGRKRVRRRVGSVQGKD